MKKQKFRPIANKKGFASIETAVLMVLFVSILYYAFGFFGAVHTGVVHNIHARTYLFETARHRTNLMYFRSNDASVPLHYYQTMTRLHGINTDSSSGFVSQQVATERPISYGKEIDEHGRKPSVHNREVFDRVPTPGRNTSVSINPIWIMTMYGLCLNSGCGG